MGVQASDHDCLEYSRIPDHETATAVYNRICTPHSRAANSATHDGEW